MKITTKVFCCFLLFLNLSSGCGRKTDFPKEEIDVTTVKSVETNTSFTDTSKNFELVGGVSLNNNTFPGVGKFYSKPAICTFTRIGERHFLTAGHCLKKLGYRERLTIRSAKDITASKELIFDLSRSYGKFKSAYDYNNPPAGLAKIAAFNNYDDWAVLTIKADESLNQSVTAREFLTKNFPILAKLGTPDFFKPGANVTIAGWGDNLDSDKLITTCTVPKKGKN